MGLQKTSIPMTKKVVISKENTVDTVDTDTVDTDTEEVDTDMVDTVDMVVVDTVHMVVATDVLVLSMEATEAMEDSEDMAAVTNTVFKMNNPRRSEPINLVLLFDLCK